MMNIQQCAFDYQPDTILDLQKLFEHLTIDLISSHLEVLKQVNNLEVFTRNDVVCRIMEVQKIVSVFI